MSKTNSIRGDSRLYYDHTNNVAITQWHDNKIVTVVSTLGVKGKTPVSRRKGPVMIDLTTEMSVRKYQKGMGGIDRGDQCRETGAGFCRKAHFKKWYKKSYFAICDFMLLNSFIAWNIAAGERGTKKNDW